MDDGYAAADARLKEVTHAALVRSLKELRSEVRDDFLVGGDDTFARFHGADRELICRMRAAHELGADLHFRVVQNDVYVVNDAVAEGAVRKVSEIEDIFDVDRFPDARRDEGGVAR